MRCPCRKKSEDVAYEACCKPYHDSERAPASAEALMRSRFSAYALEIGPYIVATWHPSRRPPSVEFAPGLEEWISLKIIAARENGDSATVEFVARSLSRGRSHEMHEVSRFVREDGRWLYLGAAENIDGQTPR